MVKRALAIVKPAKTIDQMTEAELDALAEQLFAAMAAALDKRH